MNYLFVLMMFIGSALAVEPGDAPAVPATTTTTTKASTSSVTTTVDTVESLKQQLSECKPDDPCIAEILARLAALEAPKHIKTPRTDRLEKQQADDEAWKACVTNWQCNEKYGTLYKRPVNVPLPAESTTTRPPKIPGPPQPATATASASATATTPMGGTVPGTPVEPEAAKPVPEESKPQAEQPAPLDIFPPTADISTTAIVEVPAVPSQTTTTTIVTNSPVTAVEREEMITYGATGALGMSLPRPIVGIAGPTFVHLDPSISLIVGHQTGAYFESGGGPVLGIDGSRSFGWRAYTVTGGRVQIFHGKLGFSAGVVIGYTNYGVWADRSEGAGGCCDAAYKGMDLGLTAGIRVGQWRVSLTGTIQPPGASFVEVTGLKGPFAGMGQPTLSLSITHIWGDHHREVVTAQPSSTTTTVTEQPSAARVETSVDVDTQPVPTRGPITEVSVSSSAPSSSLLDGPTPTIERLPANQPRGQ